MSFTCEMTGAMMNRLRNSDRPASTWLGGTPCSPSAFRVNDRTTKILVKLVVISRTAGTTDSSVIASRTTIELLGRTVHAVDGHRDRVAHARGHGRVGTGAVGSKIIIGAPSGPAAT